MTFLINSSQGCTRSTCAVVGGLIRVRKSMTKGGNPLLPPEQHWGPHRSIKEAMRDGVGVFSYCLSCPHSYQNHTQGSFWRANVRLPSFGARIEVLTSGFLWFPFHKDTLKAASSAGVKHCPSHSRRVTEKHSPLYYNAYPFMRTKFWIYTTWALKGTRRSDLS